MGIPVERLNKMQEGSPHVVDWIERGDVDLVINTPTGTAARTDGYEIRRAAIARGVPCITTITGGMAAARAIAAARHGRPAVRSLQEIHRASGRGAEAGVRLVSRTLAPFGRRRLTVTGRRALGAYVVLSVADPDGPAPDPGQFAMLAAAERWGGGADERPFLPRAFSVARRHADGTLDFVLEDVGPGTERLAELQPGDDVWLLGPLGRGFAPPRDGRAAAARRRRRRDRAAGDLAGRARARAALLGFRDAAHAEGAALIAGGARVATDDGSVGHHGLVTELLAAALGTTRAPRSTPAARRRCSRRCARCAPSTTCPPSSRSSPGWRAASAPASAASCRRATATCGCASTGRCSTRRRSRRCSDEFRPAVLASSDLRST